MCSNTCSDDPGKYTRIPNVVYKPKPNAGMTITEKPIEANAVHVASYMQTITVTCYCRKGCSLFIEYVKSNRKGAIIIDKLKNGYYGTFRTHSVRMLVGGDAWLFP